MAEYEQRLALAKLGFRSDTTELPAWKAEIFGIIASEVNKCERQAQRVKGRKRGNR